MAVSLIAVAGPTASGKTELALALARALGGEVISADSRQIYRGLDAATAKPKRDARGLASGIPYHMLDCADPNEYFDAGRFSRLASSFCEDIAARGFLPIVAGGTGLYLRALIEGLDPLPPRDEAWRRNMDLKLNHEGPAWLTERLREIDPESASRIPAGNRQRALRALEVFELTGRPISSFWNPSRRRPYPHCLTLVLDWPLDTLRLRIAERSARFWPAILEETAGLLDRGLAADAPGLQSLGYREAILCLKGRLDSSEGLSRLIELTNAYAKRQRTWFNRQIPSAVKIAGDDLASMTRAALGAWEEFRGARACGTHGDRP